jgi:hypothetical protein
MQRKWMSLKTIREREDEINRLKEGKRVMFALYVEQICTHKIGERITITGYSFEGKQMQISSIKLIKGWTLSDKSPFYFKYTGNVINANGEAGERVTSFKIKIEEK